MHGLSSAILRSQLINEKEASSCITMTLHQKKGLTNHVLKIHDKFRLPIFPLGKSQESQKLIGSNPLNCHHFATAFLEEGFTDALFLDGAISLIQTPERPAKGHFGVSIQVVGKSR